MLNSGRLANSVDVATYLFRSRKKHSKNAFLLFYVITPPVLFLLPSNSHPPFHLLERPLSSGRLRRSGVECTFYAGGVIILSRNVKWSENR